MSSAQGSEGVVLRIFRAHLSSGGSSVCYTDVTVLGWEVSGQLLVLHLPDGSVQYKPLVGVESFYEVRQL